MRYPNPPVELTAEERRALKGAVEFRLAELIRIAERHSEEQPSASPTIAKIAQNVTDHLVSAATKLGL